MNTPELARAAANKTPHDDGPEWCKVGEAVRRFGIGRTSLYELIRNGSIKTALIRKRGNTLGCRLIATDSLRQFIEGFVQRTFENGRRPGGRTRSTDAQNGLASEGVHS